LELPKVEFSDLQSLVQIAKENRADYRLKKAAIAYEDQNLKLQRSYAIPDINFGYQPHDKGSNYVRPYSGIVVEFSVPLFDRNQGGIQEAKINIKKEINTAQKLMRFRMLNFPSHLCQLQMCLQQWAVNIFGIFQ